MKKYLLLLALTICAITLSAADNKDSYTPLDEWPFQYREFTQATIFVGPTNKRVKAKANIHLRNSNLWFISAKDNTTKLEAQPGTVNRVEFSNGEVFVSAEGQLVKIIREDTINGSPRAIYQRQEINMEEFKSIYASRHQGALNGAGAFLENFSIDVATSINGSSENAIPLPLHDVFYFKIGDDVFRFLEGNVLKHIDSKQERAAYRAFTRKAEVIYGNLSSAQDVYTTFFMK